MCNCKAVEQYVLDDQYRGARKKEFNPFLSAKVIGKKLILKGFSIYCLITFLIAKFLYL